MSRIEERADRAFVVEVAGMTVDSHASGTRCQSCTDDGCEQLAWAQRSLAEHRAARAQTIPQQRPAVPDDRRSKEHTVITENWAKSTYSGPNCDNCVECRTVCGNVELRDTKDRSKPAMVFTPAEWNAFLAGAKDGQFDLPS